MVEWSSHTNHLSTMDGKKDTTEGQKRKRGQPLQREDRGAIRRLERLVYSNGAIAREIGCAPTTVGNGLRRGTPPPRRNKGRALLDDIMEYILHSGHNLRRAFKVLAFHMRPEQFCRCCRS